MASHVMGVRWPLPRASPISDRRTHGDGADTGHRNSTVNVTEYRSEERQRNFTVYRQVPETKDVEYQFTVMVPETHTRTVTFTVNAKTKQAGDGNVDRAVHGAGAADPHPHDQFHGQQAGLRDPDAEPTRCRCRRPAAARSISRSASRSTKPRRRPTRCRCRRPVAARSISRSTSRSTKPRRKAIRSRCRTRKRVRPRARSVAWSPSTVMKTVCEDQGHWEEVPVQNCQPACGTGCAETVCPAR